jgi:hypothetical protein
VELLSIKNSHSLELCSVAAVDFGEHYLARLALEGVPARGAMGSRRPNARLAKIHRSYSVEEMARLFNVHKNTVRNWVEQGLAAIRKDS